MSKACKAINMSRCTYYRTRHPKARTEAKPRPKPPRSLSPAERKAVIEILHQERFADQSPAAIHAKLLDEGQYLCSVRSMYRILSAHGEVRERRNQLRHPRYTKPELLATSPNQVWSWDITKLRGPVKWSYYYLYVILDIYSRYVVGWMVADRELGSLAKLLIEESCARQRIDQGQLIIHSDRGTSMTSKTVALLLADLGVSKSLNRPHVSNDNPYSESQFKTLKYRPGFPAQFGCIEDARTFCRNFFSWYNDEHYHSGIAMLTPSTVHHDRGATVNAARQAILDSAFAAHPERFVKSRPQAFVLPSAAWINPPTNSKDD